MRNTLLAAISLLAFCISGPAQQPAFHDDLLDHLAGQWVLQGAIMGSPTTHDITAEWVLGHQYMRLQEVSREKKPDGEPQYQAIVFIGWDPRSSDYACLWLDTYGWGNDNAIAHAKRSGDELPFLFQYADNPFHTTFAYDSKTDTWELRMDSEQQGKLKPFARTKLKRK